MGVAPRTAPPDEVRTIVRRELLRFAVPAVAGVVILAIASLVLSVALARKESLDNARVNAQWLVRTVLQPHLSTGLVEGRPKAIVSLDRAFDSTVTGSNVVDARLWEAGGTILYSDDPRLMGETFRSGAIPTAGPEPDATPIDSSTSENRYLDKGTEFAQVVLPVTGADGRAYTFQMIQRQDSVRDSARTIWLTFVPILLGSLVLVGTLLLILAIRMARRLSAALRHRQDLLQHAVDASELERRRISADLHDGTVQRLAGVGYTLSGLARRSARAGDDDQSRALAGSAEQVQDSVRDLRSLLVDIYPPNIERTGLHLALADVASSLGPRVTVSLDIAEVPDLDPNLATIIYRVAREAMINAARHSGSPQVDVRLAKEGGEVVLRVVDNGRGFTPGAAGDGHMGLTILTDLAESVGGDLRVTSAPEAGTTVEFRSGEAP